MALHDYVSVSHELGVPSSESGSSGEAIEATLRALVALKGLEECRTHATSSPASMSQKSKTVSFAGSATSKSNKTMPSSSSSRSSTSTSASGIGSARYSKSAESHQASGIINQALSMSAHSRHQSSTREQELGHPYRENVHAHEDQVSEMKKGKRGWIFSCCFQADEQVVERTNSRTSSRAHSSQKGDQRRIQSQGEKKSERVEVEGDGDEQPIQGLTDYERAMIERLRELLSLDTSVPTLPTQVELNSERTPISLDITNSMSMITQSFSMDTKEREALQTEPYGTVGEVANFDRERSAVHLSRKNLPSLPSTKEESLGSTSFGTKSIKLAHYNSKRNGLEESAASTANSSRQSSSLRGEKSGRRSKNNDILRAAPSATEIKRFQRTTNSISIPAGKLEKQGLPPKPEQRMIGEQKIRAKKLTSSGKSAASSERSKSKRSEHSKCQQSFRSYTTSSRLPKNGPELANSRTNSSTKSTGEEAASANGGLPPKPEMSRSRDSSETIIPTQSSNPSDYEKDGFECIIQLNENGRNPQNLHQARSEDYLRLRRENQERLLRRVSTAQPRFGPIETLTYTGHDEESSGIVDEGSLNENIPPAAHDASKILRKDPADIRDDISLLSMVSPMDPNMPFHALKGRDALDVPRKGHMLDMLSGGVFCCTTDPADAVASP